MEEFGEGAEAPKGIMRITILHYFLFLLFGKRNVLPTGGILLNEECDPFVQVDKLVVLIYSFTKIYYTVPSFHESKKRAKHT